jgi:hypothetical protein
MTFPDLDFEKAKIAFSKKNGLKWYTRDFSHDIIQRSGTVLLKSAQMDSLILIDA